MYQLYKEVTAAFQCESSRRECLALSRILDALLRGDTIAALEHTCRRLGGVHTAAETGNWAMCERLESEAEQRSFVPDAFMRSALQSVTQMQAVKKSVADGATGKGGPLVRPPMDGGSSDAPRPSRKGRVPTMTPNPEPALRIRRAAPTQVSATAQDGATFHHRARLFPLPLLASVARPSRTSSPGVRFRFKLQRTILAVTNRAICALNRLYFPSHPVSSHHFVSARQQLLLFLLSSVGPLIRGAASHTRLSSTAVRTFVLKATSWATHLSPCLDVSPSTLDMLASIPSAAGGQFTAPASAVSPTSHDSALRAGEPLPLSAFPLASAFSSAATAVVPLIAERISLPRQLTVFPRW